MRLLAIAFVGVLSLLFSSGLRADYVLWVVTPENIGEVGDLKVEAKADSFGVARFVVRREHEPSEKRQPATKDEIWRRYLKGTLRLKVAKNVWTEAAVVADAREGATEYRFAVAPVHLEIATFNVILTEGLGGEWYEIPLKAFAPKGESADAEKEATETPRTEKEGS